MGVAKRAIRRAGFSEPADQRALRDRELPGLPFCSSAPLIHGGGKNCTADRYRTGLSIALDSAALRQEENMYLALSAEVVKSYPEQIQRPLGWWAGSRSMAKWPTPSGYLDDQGPAYCAGWSRSRMCRVRCSRTLLLPPPTELAPLCTRVAVIVTRPLGRPLSRKLPFCAVWNCNIVPAFGPLCAVSSTSTSTSSSTSPISSMSSTSSPFSSSTSTTTIPQPFSSPCASSSPWLSSSSATPVLPQPSPCSSVAGVRGLSRASKIRVIAAQNGKSPFRFILALFLTPIRHTPARSPRIAPLGMRILKNLPEAFCSALREDPHRFI